MSKKFQFVMNAKMQELLDTLKEKTQRESYSEVLRDALRTYMWVVEQHENGNEVLAKPNIEGERKFTLLTFKPRGDYDKLG